MVNLAIISMGPALIPLPEGVDLSDMDRFAENLKSRAPQNLIAPGLAHAMGTLTGSFVAARLSVKHCLTIALAIALAIATFFAIGGIVMVATYGGPFWFVVADIIRTYFPLNHPGAPARSQILLSAPQSVFGLRMPWLEFLRV